MSLSGRDTGVIHEVPEVTYEQPGLTSLSGQGDTTGVTPDLLPGMTPGPGEPGAPDQPGIPGQPGPPVKEANALKQAAAKQKVKYVCVCIY